MTFPPPCESSKVRPYQSCYHHLLATDRVVTGIKAKVENKGQYDEYLRELKDVREELGVQLKEDLYPDSKPHA